MSKNIVIAGKFGGKEVLCVPALKSAYQDLLVAAERGNHWAGVAIRDLHSLTSGRIGKKNIFVNSTGMVNTNCGNEEFYVFLPGIRATAERLPSDKYKIVNLELDPSYFVIKNQQKPDIEAERLGIHRASYSQSAWVTKYEVSGDIKKEMDRVVAVSDSKYRDATQAANAVANRIVNAPGAKSGSRFNRDGFDLYLSPPKEDLKGYRKFNALVNTSAYGSALLLAETMVKAKDITGVSWVSESGGSTVLTQAMRILVDRGIKLESHSAYMHLPTTSPNEALRLAHSLGLSMDREFVKTGFFQPRMGLDMAKSISYRLANKADPYNKVDALKDVASGALKTTAAFGVIGGLGVAVGGPPAMAAIMGAVAGTTSMVSLGSGTISWGYSLLQERKR